MTLETGELLVSPKMEDHDGPVTGLSAHVALRHFISAGADGLLKVSIIMAFADSLKMNHVCSPDQFWQLASKI